MITHFRPPKFRPYLGTKTATPRSVKAISEAKRMPRYTLRAESLRKPALARLTLSCDCSSSVCGISGADSALAASVIPWKRSSFLAWVRSISASDAGRLKRANRSWARLLRWEISDSMAQTAKTKKPNTMNGIRSARPTNARITGATPQSSVLRHLSRVGRLTNDRGLNLDVHDFLDHDRSHNLSNQAEDAHLDAQRVGPQHLHVIRLDVQHHEEEQERQGDQHHAGKPAFRGQRLHLAQDAVAFADDVADLVQDLRQVATGLPLDRHRGDEEAQVEVGHAITDGSHGIFERNTEVLLLVDAAELVGDGRRHFLGHHMHARCQAMSGTQGPCHQFQGVGQLRRKGLEPLAPFVQQPQERNDKRDQPGQGCEEPGYAGEPATSGPEHRQQQADSEQGAHLDVGIGLLHDLLQAGQVRRDRLQERFLIALEGGFLQDVGARVALAAFAYQGIE